MLLATHKYIIIDSVCSNILSANKYCILYGNIAMVSFIHTESTETGKSTHIAARLDGVEYSSHCTCTLVLLSKVRKHATPACGCGVQERDIRIELQFSCRFISTSLRFFNSEWQKEWQTKIFSCPPYSNWDKRKKNRNPDEGEFITLETFGAAHLPTKQLLQCI